MMRRFSSFFKTSSKSKLSSSSGKALDEKDGKSLGRKAVSFVLFSVTGGVALSALDDLAIYHGCSSNAMEKASANRALIDAIGEPIVKGPWYNASLAVTHKRQSVSCSFPVSGPQGNGMLRLKAIRKDDNWLTFLRPSDWDIIILDALLHIPGNEVKEQTQRISLSDNFASPACKPCASFTGCSLTDQKPQQGSECHDASATMPVGS